MTTTPEELIERASHSIIGVDDDGMEPIGGWNDRHSRGKVYHFQERPVHFGIRNVRRVCVKTMVRRSIKNSRSLIWILCLFFVAGCRSSIDAVTENYRGLL